MAKLKQWRFTLWFTLCAVGHGYPYFKDTIPNGHKIPHPCVDGLTWEGVGHENFRGGGTRNVFGLDFFNNGKVWNTVLCNMDSDGDGRKNGEELGDPDCTWTPGSSPKYTTGLSHPGICEPFDSASCGGQPSYVDCEAGKFECDAINEKETFNFTIRFPETPVPAKATTYICINFELPMDKEYHLVAFEPYITNQDIMHHILVFGCDGATEAPGPLGQPKECGEGMNGCREMIAGWTSGGYGRCLNKNMGFLIGANKGLKYGVMQHHWNNPQEINGYVDSSGMTFHLTSRLRPFNAGFLIIGQYHLDIPPGREFFSRFGSCDGSCTSQIMANRIYVTDVGNHMHLLGRAQYTDLRRNGTIIRRLASDQVYDYNTPVKHTHPDPILVNPGDELATTCVFTSSKKTKTTQFGEATSDEMCLSFLTFYPRENLRTSECVAYRSLSHCEMRYQEVLDGCNIRKFLNYSDPDTMSLLYSVREFCQPGICFEECLSHVRRLKKQPCFTGDVGKFLRETNLQYSKNKLETIAWYARLDSCDSQLVLEQYGTDTSAGSVCTTMQLVFMTASVLSIACFQSFL